MSELRVDSVKSKGGGAPNLPKGVTISGITTAVTLGVTNIDGTNVNVSGVVTSGTLSGELLSTGTPTLGLGVTINSSGVVISGVATAGIVSATTLYGDGSNITGVGVSIAPLFYNPDIYKSAKAFDTGIGITFNQQIKAGTGNITLSIANAGVAGTVVENFGVGSSVTISENTITIDPTADLSEGGDYMITYPSGCFTNNEGTDYVGTAYTFQSAKYNYELWVWGDNTYGQLGQNQAPAQLARASSPTQIPGTTWKQYTITNDNGALAIKTTGTLWSWGSGVDGQLGQNDTVYRSSPTQVGTDTTWSFVFAAAQVGVSVKTDGTLWAWGRNEYGVLGQNNTTHYSSPKQIGTDTTWSQDRKKLSLGSRGAAAIKTDGTLWTWGTNSTGNLGLNQTSAGYSSPIQVGTDTTWSEVQMTGASGGLKTDGTLWAWGTNWHGGLGQNDRTQRSSPVQVPGTTWSSIFNNQASNPGLAGLKTDGTLWSWGYNESGVLGLNQSQATVLAISSPTQIPGTTWSSNTSNFGYGMAAIKTDNTLWMWGYAGNGALGQNSVVQYSSPVQVPGTDWDTAQFTYAIAVGVLKKS